jgi:hypothetical protein
LGPGDLNGIGDLIDAAEQAFCFFAVGIILPYLSSVFLIPQWPKFGLAQNGVFNAVHLTSFPAYLLS